MFKAKQAYLQTQVTTTSRGELVVLLYDGAIKFLRLAKEKMAEKNYAEKGNLISKALGIIQELDSSLNMKKGADLSVNLHSLYVYAQGKLLQANLKMNQDFVEEIIVMLTSLRDAFAEIVNTPEAIEAQKMAPEQTPVNVSQFKERKMFEWGEGLSAPSAPTVPTVPVNSAFRAKAYQQQASAFGAASVAPVEAVAAVTAETNQIVKQNLEQSVPVATPATPTAPQTQITQTKTIVPQAAATPLSAIPPSGISQGMSGFARQMINNSMYKKMAMTNQSPTAEK